MEQTENVKKMELKEIKKMRKSGPTDTLDQ